MLAKISLKGIKAKTAGQTMAVPFPDHSLRDASYRKEELPEGYGNKQKSILEVFKICLQCLDI